MEEQSSKKIWWQKPLKFFIWVSAWIIGPILIALVAGSWLDLKLKTQPWFFFFLTLFSFLVSCVGITRAILTYNLELMREINKEKNGTLND